VLTTAGDVADPVVPKKKGKLGHQL